MEFDEARNAPEVARPQTADGIGNRAPSLAWAIYWAMHLGCFAVVFTGVSGRDLLLFAGTFFVRMLAITGGYHRYFSHRTYKTSRAFQALLAVAGTAATQKGPLWWAGNHRHHHAHADTDRDVHSPRQGLYHAHQGWIAETTWERTPLERIPDFARFPELVFLNRWHFLAPLALALGCLAVGGWSGLVWGYLISTTALWHTTYSVNSVAHRWGSRRYATPDTSRNNWWVALLTLGEGWHNNHHHYMASARQGFFWWEIDVTYYALRALAALGLIWDLREPPAHVRAAVSPPSLREAA